MKKKLSLLLICMGALCLCACGGKKEGQKASEAVTENELKNELDASSPVPPDPGNLTVEEQRFEEQHLTVGIVQGMSVTQEGDDIIVRPSDSTWEIRFRQLQNNQITTLLSNARNTYSYDGETIYPDHDEKTAVIQGFETDVIATNIKEGWEKPEDEWQIPAVRLILRYGSVPVGRFGGLLVRLTIQDYEKYKNIYEVLRLDEVAAVLNHFSVIEGDEGNTVSAGGITVTFPGAWTANAENYTGPFAQIIESGEARGSVHVQSGANADPAAMAGYVSSETFEKTYGDRTFICAFRNTGTEEKPEWWLEMYSTFSDARHLCVKLILNGKTQEEIRSYADSDLFKGIMESVQTDPSLFKDPSVGVDATGYTRNENGVLTGYTGSDTALVIPSEIEGMAITGIGGAVFENNTSITSVVIPEGVTYVDYSAFNGCENLQSVTFPSSLTSIGNSAFANCRKLSDVVLGPSLSQLGLSAFAGSGAGSLEIQGSPVLSQGCFQNSSFSTVSVSGQCDLSGTWIFAGCTASQLTLGEGITAIGESSFSGMPNLTELHVPDSVTSLGKNAFSNSGIRKINVPAGVTDIPEFCYWLTDLHLLKIPEGVTHIGPSGVRADVVSLGNPKAVLDENAIMTAYLFLCGAYSGEELGFDVSTGVWASRQIALPMDATMAQSDAFDDYLEQHGKERISWVGIAPAYLNYDIDDFSTEEYDITDYHGTDTHVCIPVYSEDEMPLSNIREGALEGKNLEELVISPYIWNIPSHAFAGNPGLMDLYLSSDAACWPERKEESIAQDAFSGLPEGVTIHLPASLTEGERASVEEYIRGRGIPASAVFDYYSLQG